MAAIVRIHIESDEPLVVTVSGDNKPPHTVEISAGGGDVALPMASGDFITIAGHAVTPSRSTVPEPDVPVLSDLFVPIPDQKEA